MPDEPRPWWREELRNLGWTLLFSALFVLVAWLAVAVVFGPRPTQGDARTDERRIGGAVHTEVR